MRPINYLAVALALGSSARLTLAQDAPRPLSPQSFRAQPTPFTDTLWLRGRSRAVAQIEALSVPDSATVLWTISVNGGVSNDSVWLDRQTFAPLRHVARIPGRLVDVRYAQDSVIGVDQDSTGTHVVRQRLARAAFDYSTLSLILRYLPERAGASGSVATFDVEHASRVLGFISEPEPPAGDQEPQALRRIVVDFSAWKTAYRIDVAGHRHFGYDLLRPNVPPVQAARRTP